MKSIASILSFCVLFNVLASPVARADDRDEVIKKELERVQNVKKELSDSKKSLEKLNADIASVEKDLAKARKSSRRAKYVFIPAAVVTGLGVVFMVATHNKSGWQDEVGGALSKGLAPLVTTITGITAGISGVRLLMKTHDISEFEEKLEVLKKLVANQLAKVKSDARVLAKSEHALCGLEGVRPASECDAEYETFLSALN